MRTNQKTQEQDDSHATDFRHDQTRQRFMQYAVPLLLLRR